MSTLLECSKCGRQRGEEGSSPTLDPRFRVAFCVVCKTRRMHSAVGQTILGGHGQARHTDPPTAKAAARTVRTGSAKMKLLLAHQRHPEGLTDEEAAIDAGLSLASEYATRCSELKAAGMLEDTTTVRTGHAGMARIVRQITEPGIRAIGE